MVGPPDEPADDPFEDPTDDLAGSGSGRRRVRRPRGRPIPGDRRCQACDTKLSTYNPGPYCWQHSMGWPWRGPAAGPRY